MCSDDFVSMDCHRRTVSGINRSGFDFPLTFQKTRWRGPLVGVRRQHCSVPKNVTHAYNMFSWQFETKHLGFKVEDPGDAQPRQTILLPVIRLRLSLMASGDRF